MVRFPSSRGQRQIAPVWIGYGLTALWIGAVALLFWLIPDTGNPAAGGPGRLMLIFAILFPVALIWAVVFVTQALRTMRAETTALRQALEKLDQGAVTGSAPPSVQDTDLRNRLDEITSLTRQTDSRLSALADKALRGDGKAPAPRGAPALPGRQDRQADAANQPALPLSGPKQADRAPVSIAEFIRALDFPKTADDRDGFRILRRATEDRRLSKLLTVAQDLLSLMAADKVFMDDLHPDLPRPRVWRRFAQGERGLTISALGGIRDRAALTLIKARMKSDSAFRDKAHRFLREFDTVLREFEQAANDDELNAMAMTRSARAFMLLGRVAGTFD